MQRKRCDASFINELWNSYAGLRNTMQGIAVPGKPFL